MYLVLRYATVGPWGYAGSAVEDLCRGRGGRAAHADVRIVKEERHVIPHKVQEPHGPKVEAAQRLQRQARQGGTLQLACIQCMPNSHQLACWAAISCRDADEARRSLAALMLATMLCLVV